MRGIWQMMGKGKAPSCVRHWPFRLSGWARVGLEGEACGRVPPRKQIHSPMCSLLSLMMLPVKLRRLKYFREGGSAQVQGRTKNRSHDKPNAPPITWLLVLLDAVRAACVAASGAVGSSQYCTPPYLRDVVLGEEGHGQGGGLSDEAAERGTVGVRGLGRLEQLTD